MSQEQNQQEQNELAALTQALQRSLERRRRLGVRRAGRAAPQPDSLAGIPNTNPTPEA
ncbi:MAG: hypothetical protein JKY61_11835, partial [Planctomycetes bacterium]|nr:hypothetical protein [Planctomycetota bacterium]